jgi:hypothetical protein
MAFAGAIRAEPDEKSSKTGSGEAAKTLELLQCQPQSDDFVYWKLKDAKAEVVANVLDIMATVRILPGARVVADPNTNGLLVRAPAATILRAKKIVKSWDWAAGFVRSLDQ